MCKSSCCPGDRHSGGGLAALAVITIVILAAVARPAAHAALAALRVALTIAVITVATLSGLAVLAVVALVIRRARRARFIVPAEPPAVIPVRAGVPVTGRTPLALAPPELARRQHAELDLDPEQVAQIIAAVLRGRHD
jgi:hypothetical protein